MTLTTDEMIEFWMPRVARCPNAWASRFARSMIGQAKRPGWCPSPKQSAMMRRLITELSAHEDEFELIEEIN